MKHVDALDKFGHVFSIVNIGHDLTKDAFSVVLLHILDDSLVLGLKISKCVGFDGFSNHKRGAKLASHAASEG